LHLGVGTQGIVCRTGKRRTGGKQKEREGFHGMADAFPASISVRGGRA
jgi:hypothetical protein